MKKLIYRNTKSCGLDGMDVRCSICPVVHGSTFSWTAQREELEIFTANKHSITCPVAQKNGGFGHVDPKSKWPLIYSEVFCNRKPFKERDRNWCNGIADESFCICRS